MSSFRPLWEQCKASHINSHFQTPVPELGSQNKVNKCDFFRNLKESFGKNQGLKTLHKGSISSLHSCDDAKSFHNRLTFFSKSFPSLCKRGLNMTTLWCFKETRNTNACVIAKNVSLYVSGLSKKFYFQRNSFLQNQYRKNKFPASFQESLKSILFILIISALEFGTVNLITFNQLSNHIQCNFLETGATIFWIWDLMTSETQ